MNDRCKLADTDLVAYAAGDLKGARREYVEAHVAVCPACRRRVEEYREIDRLLQHTVRDADIPDQRAAIKARLAVEEHRRSRRDTLFRTVRPAAVAAGLLLVVLALAFPLQSTWADFRLARFVGFTSEGSQPEVRPAHQGPPGEPIGTLAPSGLDHRDLLFEPVVLEQLPDDLTLTGQSSTSPDAIELRYETPTGMRVRLTEQLPGDTDRTTVQRDEAEIAYVGDTEVLLQANSPRGEVSRMLWKRQGILFELLVIRDPPDDGLEVEAAHRIVRAVTEAQDAP